MSSTITYKRPKSNPNEAAKKKAKEATSPQPVVVFDIDGVLAKLWQADPFNELAQIKKLFGTAQDIHFLDILGCTHQIYIGTYALLRALRDRKVEIAFFSAGSMERNALLVEKLYQIAFKQAGTSLFQQTRIYSRDHCIAIQRPGGDEATSPFFPNLRLAQMSPLKKDLRILLLNPKTATDADLMQLHRLGKIKASTPDVDQLLKNAVLIEDHDCYMVKDQEYNLLYVKGRPNPFLQKPEKLTIDLTKEEVIITDDYFKDFYHLFYAYYILDEALHLYETQDISFRDAMATIQMAHNNKALFELERNTPLSIPLEETFHYNTDVKLAHYKKGMQRLKPYWPTLDFVADTLLSVN